MDLAMLYYEYGLLFKAKGEPTEAKAHLEKALAMSREMGMRLREGKCGEAVGELE